MRNKIVFIVINALLVVAVGLIVGLVFADTIFQAPAGVTAFAFLLTALAIPSLIYVFFNSKLNTGGRIISSFLVIAEVILNIVFLCIPKADIKIYAIIQLAMIVITLVAFLIIIGLFKDNNAKESN